MRKKSMAIQLSKEQADAVRSRNIALIGFMGAGKTTISRALHDALGLTEAETDAAIVAREGMPITQIFAEKGEPYFRAAETQVIRSLQEERGLVISCGGGVAMRRENVDALRAGSRIVLLTAEPETILERVKDSTDRPLLNGHMNVEYIAQLMEVRRPKYEAAADITVATDGKSAQAIAEEIIQRILETQGND